MFEDMTYEAILSRLLDRVPDEYDKREGSVIWFALAPVAAQLQLTYIDLDRVLEETFADTASRDYLVKRAAERGIAPRPATYAMRQGEFNLDIPIGARFNLGELNYVALEKVRDGVFKMQCTTLGEAGNQESGMMTPLETIAGLEWAKLTRILIPGEDEEETEHLRQRYFDSLSSQAFGGNVTDYKEKVKALNGVGGVKVYPVWNGGGTVRLVLLDTTFSKPSQELIDLVQAAVDPLQTPGQGKGVAPIGHVVTVAGCEEKPVDIAVSLTFQDGWDWAAVKPYAEEAVDKYFRELAAGWAEGETMIVRRSQIETRLLDLTGVLDVADTRLDGLAKNLIIALDHIPVRGDLNG